MKNEPLQREGRSLERVFSREEVKATARTCDSKEQDADFWHFVCVCVWMCVLSWKLME